MIGEARRALAVPKEQRNSRTKGDEADAVFYIQTGRVKLTERLHECVRKGGRISPSNGGRSRAGPGSVTSL
jgi:hypothetical protein